MVYLLPRGVWVDVLPVHVLLLKIQMLSRLGPPCARCSVVLLCSLKLQYLTDLYKKDDDPVDFLN